MTLKEDLNHSTNPEPRPQRARLRQIAACRRASTVAQIGATIVVLCFAGAMGACQKKPSRPGPGTETKQPPASSTPPRTEPTSTNPGSNPPDTMLRIDVKRINAESWWKVCLDAWVVEFPKTKISIGCNTDSDLASKRIEIAGSSKACNTIALSASIYRNVSPCSAAGASSCEHETAPMHQRQTSAEADKDYFRAAYRADLKWPFTREDLKVIRMPESETGQYSGSSEPASGKSSFVVFFEDQNDANFNAWKDGASASQKGIDFFDYVVEFSSQSAPMSLQGNPNITCAENK